MIVVVVFKFVRGGKSGAYFFLLLHEAIEEFLRLYSFTATVPKPMESKHCTNSQWPHRHYSNVLLYWRLGGNPKFNLEMLR